MSYFLYFSLVLFWKPLKSESYLIFVVVLLLFCFFWNKLDNKSHNQVFTLCQMPRLLLHHLHTLNLIPLTLYIGIIIFYSKETEVHKSKVKVKKHAREREWARATESRFLFLPDSIVKLLLPMLSYTFF